MKSKLEKELAHINQQLVRLNLQQEQLARRQKEIQERIEEEQQSESKIKGVIHYRIATKIQRPEKPRHVRKSEPISRRNIIIGEGEYDDDIVPRIGDRVRIINPKAGQPNKGNIEGFCVDGKAKIRCERNILITRQIKNLRYQVVE